MFLQPVCGERELTGDRSKTMGICKCRVVTALFCFQHRVNVCEQCMMREHNTCIVKTYQQWLLDNDFDPTCKLCREPLNNGSEVVRLLCHDVVHGRCLNDFVVRTFGPDTAPAGYTCPVCSGKSVVPPDNNMSPVAIALRNFVTSAPWAALHSVATRTLPEPALADLASAAADNDDDVEDDHGHGHDHDHEHAEPTHRAAPQWTASAASPAGTLFASPASASAASSSLSSSTTTTAAAAIVQAAMPPSRRPPVAVAAADSGLMSRRGPANTAINMPDEGDKYARRPANAWFAQLVGNRVPVSRPQDTHASFKRGAIMLLLLVIVIITLIEVLTRARPSGEGNELLDEHRNPFVRTE